jgi:hypothetical protein
VPYIRARSTIPHLNRAIYKLPGRADNCAAS